MPSARASSVGDSDLYRDLQPNQIRLVSFDRLSLDAIRLRAYDIDNCPPYAALTYRWGDAGIRDAVTINEHPTTIHRNLSIALQSIITQVGMFQNPPDDDTYVPKGPRMTAEGFWTIELWEVTAKKQDPEDAFTHEYFWMDGICINQENLRERGRQVQMMASIFKSASRVLIRLADTGCQHTIRHLNDLYYRNTCALSDTCSCGFPDDLEKQVQAFLFEPYWKRAWVRQEVRLARDFDILCGSNMLPRSHLAGHSRALETWTMYEHSPFEVVALFRNQEEDLTDYGELLEWVYMLEPSECSDDRDKIYSLLGLIDTSSSKSCQPLEADYTITREELFGRVLIHLLDFGKIHLSHAETLAFVFRWPTAQHLIRWMGDQDLLEIDYQELQRFYGTVHEHAIDNVEALVPSDSTSEEIEPVRCKAPNIYSAFGTTMRRRWLTR